MPGRMGPLGSMNAHHCASNTTTLHKLQHRGSKPGQGAPPRLSISMSSVVTTRAEAVLVPPDLRPPGPPSRAGAMASSSSMKITCEGIIAPRG